MRTGADMGTETVVYRTLPADVPALQEHHLNLGGSNNRECIEVTNRYLVRNGRPWIPIMGEMHYVRVPRAQWRESLSRMKAGGITTVSAYVIWIYHEEEEGSFDFTGSRDLRAFVRTAQECGLEVVLRIGPWVHGEVRNGGFPDWLIKKGIPLRRSDARYLEYVRRFYRKISEQVQSQLFGEDGPVWGIQLENELTDGAEHLLDLKRIAIQEGLQVPVYTVTGWNARNGAKIPEKEVLPVFGGYVEAPWEQHMEKLEPSSHWFFLPDRNDSGIGKDLIACKDAADSYRMNYDLYPFATCELGGGIQPTCHRRPVMGENDAAAAAQVALGSGNNLPGYYMYRGGCNQISHTTLQESRATGYPNDYTIRNYDFQAPLGEWGQTGGAYRKLKLQHLFLQCFGQRFAPMHARFQENPPGNRQDTRTLRYCVRTDGAGGYVFVNNYQRLDTLPEHRDVQFEVPVQEGGMVFPERGMSVPSGAYFFLPYRMPMGEGMLEYATAQPLWREDNVWFFLAISDAPARYCVRGRDGHTHVHTVQAGKTVLTCAELEGCRIVTLTPEEAENFYPAGGEIYVTSGAELYLQNGRPVLRREGNPDLSYYRWNGNQFEYNEIRLPEEKQTVDAHPVPPEEFEGRWKEELFLNGEKEIRGWRLSIHRQPDNRGEGYLEISYVGDVLQVYADGELADDEFYKGVPFVTRDVTEEAACTELWVSRLEPGDCYLEQGEKEGLSLLGVRRIPVYKKILL